MHELAKNPDAVLAQTDIGYYMDVLQGRLKQIATKNLVINRRGDHIVLEFSDVDFDARSVQINAATRDTLAPVVNVLNEYRKTLVSITLRTEDAETPPKPGLNAKRAQAVAHYLATSGIVARRIVVVGSSGESAPVGDAAVDSHSFLELELDPIVLDLPNPP